VVHPASSCGYWEEGKTGWTVGAVAPPSAPDEGVAIATALMPPVCTVGIGLAKADPAAASGVLLGVALPLASITTRTIAEAREQRAI